MAKGSTVVYHHPMHIHLLRSTVALSLLSLLSACAPTGLDDAEPIELQFVAHVGGEPFACNERYSNFGAGNATIQPADLRAYVHNVRVVANDGSAFAVTLDDNDFQKDGVALLDFEDGSGACDTGSPELHTSITGQVAAGLTVTAVRFTLGVPEALNHLDVSVAEPPFNIPSLWWSWAGGYKFIKADVLVGDDELAAYFHHGSTSCTGTPADGFSCAYDHLVDVEVAVDPTTQAIGIDLAAMYASVDVAADLVEGDNVRGCMSFSNDPDCRGMMASIGVAFADDGTPQATAFSAVEQ
jgi:uncharacterized repeat protein (TIGR04052 family)